MSTAFLQDVDGFFCNTDVLTFDSRQAAEERRQAELRMAGAHPELYDESE